MPTQALPYMKRSVSFQNAIFNSISFNKKHQQRHAEDFVEIIKIPVFKPCFATMFIMRVILYLSPTYFHKLY